MQPVHFLHGSRNATPTCPDRQTHGSCVVRDDNPETAQFPDASEPDQRRRQQLRERHPEPQSPSDLRSKARGLSRSPPASMSDQDRSTSGPLIGLGKARQFAS